MDSGKVPSKEECLTILKKYNTPLQVIQHCLTVTKIVEEFISEINNINNELVVAGAMLHDIGRSIDHTIFHAVKGVEILKEENLDTRILSIVRNHIGTGIEKEEAIKLGLPPEDYIPQTYEEILVSYSDNLAFGKKKRSFDEALNEFIDKFGSKSNIVKRFYEHKEIIEKLRRIGKKKS
ncbi:MAG: HDIG domain-containing metalloprotein [Candidatus Thorarchaeota archaeon]